MRLEKYSQRGFRQYRELKDSYGADVLLYQSSNVEPHIWLGIEGGQTVSGDEERKAHAHLNVPQALEVAAGLLEWAASIVNEEYESSEEFE